MSTEPNGDPSVSSAKPTVAPPTSLHHALQRHARSIPDQMVATLDSYARQLWDWNTRLNLTRHVDYDTFVSRDITDSEALAQHLAPGESILDVGTGGGVPGIVLAILRPDLRVCVCESVQKKAMCVQQIVTNLALPVTVFSERAEDVVTQQYFETLTVRGVARLDQLVRTFQRSWQAFGRMLLVKGPRWIEERAAARHVGLMRTLELRKLSEYRSGQAASFILQIRRKPDVASSVDELR